MESNGARNTLSYVSYDERPSAKNHNDVEPRVFAYDYSLLPLSDSQRELFDEIKAAAPIAMWRYLDRYNSRYQAYAYARIMRLSERNLLAVVYDGPRGGARIHVASLLVRPGEIWAMPNGELIAWRQGDMWHIKAKWIAVRQGRKRIMFALPHEVLKAAELPRKLYVATEYKKNDIRYLIAAPSAEIAEAIKTQTTLANLGEA